MSANDRDSNSSPYHIIGVACHPSWQGQNGDGTSNPESTSFLVYSDVEEDGLPKVVQKESNKPFLMVGDTLTHPLINCRMEYGFYARASLGPVCVVTDLIRTSGAVSSSVAMVKNPSKRARQV
jgi:hypothetical protein